MDQQQRREVRLDYDGGPDLPVVVPDSPSAGIVAKLERADRHLREVCAAVSAVAMNTRAEIAIADNHETGYREFTLHAVDAPTPPVEISLAAGDVVHNLRTSLDHLMCQLVIINGRVVTRDTMLPMARSKQVYDKIRAKRTAGASAEAIRRIDAVAPYVGGAGAALYELHELDVADKHKLLLTTVAASTTVVLDMRRSVLAMHEQMRIGRGDPDPLPFSLADMPAIELPLRAAEPTRLEDGGVVFRTGIGDTSHDDTRAQFHVVIESDGVLDNEPVVARLMRLSSTVRQTYLQFADLLM